MDWHLDLRYFVVLVCARDCCQDAIESMQEGGGRLSVSLAADPSAREVTIRIADTGSGIREQDLGHIFDPYFTTKASGTGLGLAIAQKIIEGHGGRIEIESQVNKGSSFTVILPIAKKRTRSTKKRALQAPQA